MTATAVRTDHRSETVIRGSDYARLSRMIRDAGLLEPRRGAYAVRIALTAAAFVASWVAFVLIGESWYQTITAVVLGVVFTQVGFLGHECGHRQVARTRRGNDLLGLISGNLLVGLSFGWWIDKHNRHHAQPNTEGADPDIGAGLLAFTDAQVLTRTGWFARALVRYQAWLFFPLLTLEGLNLHVASIRAVLTQPARRYRRTEIILLTLHLTGYLTAMLLVLSPIKALTIIAIHQGVFGLYMGCAFAPNHKGMLIIPAGADVDYLRRQVLTSRNVRGGWLVDQLLGGLNYQIEHHLFPSMPRPSLRRARPIVRAYCQHLDLPYTETTLFTSYAAALRHLHSRAQPLRTRRGRTPIPG
jgi:fatty acid desaturase